MAGSGRANSRAAANSELRSDDRAKRRLMVRFGVDIPDKTGFTGNVSEGGLFIRTNAALRPGTMIQVEIEFPDRRWNLWARVAWAKKVPPQLAHVLVCGMGVEFVDPPDDWSDFFDVWSRKIGLR